MNKLFEKWAADGITRQAAQAYIDWLDKKEAQRKQEDPEPVQIAYLPPLGEKLQNRVELNTTMLGCLWGFYVLGTYWCRWHTDMVTGTDLEKWLVGRKLPSLQEVNERGSKYEQVRFEFFYKVAGSTKIKYGIPTVEDFQKIFLYLKESSMLLRELGCLGVVVQDWFMGEGYWAYDSETERLVVFNLKEGRLVPFEKDEIYNIRPVWLK